MLPHHRLPFPSRRCGACTRRILGPLLEQLDLALLVSTYQAGKLVVLRSDAGVINTHFRPV